MIPSISLVLANAPETVVATAETVLGALSSRYEILCCGASQRLIERFQWLWPAHDTRSALQAATGDLIIVANAGADFAELATLVPWAAECSFVCATAKRGWWHFWHHAAPNMAVIRRAELKKLLADRSGQCDLSTLTATARRAGITVTAPTSLIAA